MKKRIKYLLGFMGMMVLTIACSDSFLDEKVLDSFAPESLNDKLGYEAAVIGLHNTFSTLYTTEQDQTFLGMAQLGTDIVWAPNGNSNGMARPYFDYAQLKSTDAAAAKLWTSLYKIINNANIIIKSSADNAAVDMTPDQIDAYSAEARFFRAYSYNMLATLYGGVPLVTEPVTSARTDFTRASIADVDHAIEQDLLFAIAKLPEVDAAVKGGRANKAMAHQLLAEVYLRVNKPDLAEAQCDAVINGGKFSLTTNRFGVKSGQPGDAFSDMFIFGNQRRSQGNKEVIWVMEQENPTLVPGGSTGFPQQRRVWVAAYHNLPAMSIADSLGGRGLARVRLNNWVLYKLYKGSDMRNSKYTIHRLHYFNNPDAKYSAVYRKQVPYGQNVNFTLGDGSEIKIFASDTIFKSNPYTLKWGQFDPKDEFGFGMWKDFIIMRLGETYLLRAEARLKQNKLAAAAADINALRLRANAVFVTSADMNLNFILDERARELLGEENRRMTLVRTGTLVERATRLNGTAPLAGGAIETTNGLQSHNILLPIPQSEIDLNKDAQLEQNPGY